MVQVQMKIRWATWGRRLSRHFSANTMLGPHFPKICGAPGPNHREAEVGKDRGNGKPKCKGKKTKQTESWTFRGELALKTIYNKIHIFYMRFDN